MSWSNDELDDALARYEQLCRANGMTKNAIFSYWDYARPFLAWRVGEYRPSAAVAPGTPSAEISDDCLWGHRSAVSCHSRSGVLAAEGWGRYPEQPAAASWTARPILT